MAMTVQHTWGHLVAWYLFLAGAGAGVYMIAVGNKIWKKVDNLERIGYFWGPALVAIGSFLLFLDLGQPLRAFLAIMRPHSSMISVGTVILTLFMAIGFFQAYQAYIKKAPAPVLDYLGFFLAIGTATYTGLLLGVVKAIPFWNHPVLLPFLFLISALSSGVGLLLLISLRDKSFNEESKPVLARIMRLDMGLILIEIVLLAALLVVSSTGNAAMMASAAILLTGSFALPFWGLVVLAGLLLPLILEWSQKDHNPNVTAVCGLGLLMGGLALRYAIVAAGVWIPLG